MLPNVTTGPQGQAQRGFSSHRPLLAVTYLVIAGTLAFVAAAVAPSIGRALGLSEVRTVSRSSQRTTSVNRAGVEAVEEKERLLGAGDLDDDLDPDNAARTAAIRTKSAVVFDTPGKKPITALPAGAMIRILGERSDFFHVLYEDQGEAAIGWVKKSDVLVR
jgi:hypothetical protein